MVSGKVNYIIGKIHMTVTYAYILTKLYWPPKTKPPSYIKKGCQTTLRVAEQLRILSTMFVEMSPEDLRSPVCRNPSSRILKED